MKNPNISCRSHWNPSDKTASLFNKEEMLLFLISLCFHALSRANLISTAARLLCMKGLGMYQCPQSGNPHFYSGKTGCISWKGKCVNAFNRANPISTLPSQSRLFKPLFGLVFACNFRSCLIINYNKEQKWAEVNFFLNTILRLFLYSDYIFKQQPFQHCAQTSIGL